MISAHFELRNHLLLLFYDGTLDGCHLAAMQYSSFLHLIFGHLFCCQAQRPHWRSFNPMLDLIPEFLVKDEQQQHDEEEIRRDETE